MSEEDLHAPQADDAKGSSQPGAPSGLPAAESDGPERIVILLASVGDSDAADAGLELAFVALLDVAR